MSPEEIGLLFFLSIVSVFSAGGFGWKLSKRRKQRRLEKQGEENLRQQKLQAALHCLECEKPVSPEDGAIFDKNAWWCSSCWHDKTIRGKFDEQKRR